MEKLGALYKDIEVEQPKYSFGQVKDSTLSERRKYAYKW